MINSSVCKRPMAILTVAIGLIGAAITSQATSVSLAGDSTVTTASGWGGKLIEFLPFGVTVKNEAISGTSTKSFIDGGDWQSTVDLDCDYVLIQFGHNDQKLSDTARGTYPIEIRPAGVTTRIYDMTRTNLVKMVEEVQAEGGTPVLVTPLARRGRATDTNGVLQFQNDVPVTSYADTLGNSYSLLDYADAAKAVAAQKGITCVDLNQLSLDLYNQMIDDGEDITTLGPDGDNTHLNSFGAEVIAEIVADELRELLPDASLWDEPQDVGDSLLIFTNELDEAADYGSFTVLSSSADNPSINTSDLGGTPNEVQVQTLITSAGSANFSFMSAATCDPITLGGIGPIGWSTEIRKQAGGQNDTPLTPALQQGGRLFRYVGGAINGGTMAPDAFRNTSETYTTVSLEGATASDFESYDSSSPRNPNFSWTGTAITFGYIASAGTSSTGYDRRTAIRNSKITVGKPPLSLSTAYGNGEDTQIAENSKTSTAGSSTAVNARWLTNPAALRHEQIVLRFDLSLIGSATITNASLEMAKYRAAAGATMDLYGVIDGKSGDALEDWTEGSLTYANAPWIEQDEIFDDMDLITNSVVKLDTAFPVVGISGSVMSTQSTNLLNFLQSDKNGLVTFIFTREDLDSSGTQERYASKEATALDEGGGSGSAGDFAPRLLISLQYPPTGTVLILK